MDINDNVEIDEATGRTRQKFNVFLKAVGETWKSPTFKQSGMRKLFIKNFTGEVLMGTFGADGPLSIMKPDFEHDYHNGSSVWLECRQLGSGGEAQVYIHAEWD